MLELTPNTQLDDREVLVRVENVSKKFCRSLKKSLWYGVQDITSEVVGRKYDHELRPDEFWAVNDISFDLRRGECLGLIGPNGSGKSTLLKMLNGLIKPDRGRIEINGRVGALIELGTGFNPILTGRENIYVNGSVLGFSREEIAENVDNIIEFSEIGEFIDTPVQNYSSGMKVRLGFAVAAQMEPDILFIDEVLAVGDVGFRMKCFNRIFEISNNSAIILVSHSMPQVMRVASQLLLLSRGEILCSNNDVVSGIERYFDLFEVEKSSVAGNGKAILHKIFIHSSNGEATYPVPCIRYFDDLLIDISFSICRDIDKFSIHIGIMDREAKTIAQSFSRASGFDFRNKGQVMEAQIRIKQIPFSLGTYSLNVNFIKNSVEDIRGEYLGHYRAAAQFKAVNYSASIQAPIQLAGEWSLLD